MIIDKLVPESFKDDRKVYRSSTLIIRIDLLVLLTSICFAPLFYLIGFTEACLIFSYAAVNAVLFLFLIYFSENLVLVGNYFSFNSLVVFTALVWFSGGLSSPYLMWLLTIPPIAVFYLNERDVKIWSMLTVLTILALFALHIGGYNFPQSCPEKWLPVLAFINYTFVLILFVSVVRSFGVSFRRINRKLAKSNSELKQSNKELERFAFIASHDLKSPLRNIVSFLNLFERRYAKTVDDTGREYLQFVSDSAQQMHSLIEDILEYSRTANREAKLESVDLNQLLGTIRKQLLNTPAYSHAQIDIPRLPVVEADATLMKQLFQNFLENGLKYNESSLPLVSITHKQKQQHHFFTVTDNGIGIDAQYKDQIFEMFKRLHNKDKYSGTGIGLAICKRIIDEYDGEVSVTSEVGKGTILSFKLSLNAVQHPVPAEESHRPAESVFH